MSDDGLLSLADLPPERAAAKLRAVGEFDAAAARENSDDSSSDGGAKTFGFGLGSVFGLETNAWALPVDVFGYIPPGATGDLIDIVDVSQVRPQVELRGTRVNVTLQRMRTYDLPGRGEHTICFDFSTENWIGKTMEEAHYSVSTTATDGNFAAITNFPMFRGLGLGSEGLSLHWRLINVKSESDEQLLNFIHSDVVQTGLKLVATAQPALGLLGSVADGLAKYLNSSDNNAIVQDKRLGLDYSPNAGGAGLACGSYVAVQATQSAWQDWSRWAYDTRNALIVSRDGSAVPYNYLMFGIDRYSGE
ncbi:MAG: hypothetical protein M3R53_03780 [Candidatus Eremiobacteraeota bacterium]|nr:hypothetical protein [Candidatus Eremiobacteraeota bacterium]